MLRIVRYTLLFLAVTNQALTCPAQSKDKSRPLKQPPSISVDAPDNWKEFSSKEGGFRVLFPGTPKQISVRVDLSGGESLVHVATYESPIIYNAIYTDCPVNAGDSGEVNDYFDNLRIGELESEGWSGLSPRVLSEADMPLNQYPGRFLHADLKDRIYRRRAVIAKGRLYMLTVTTLKKAERASEMAKRYERLSMKFLNSFNLIADGSHDDNRAER